MGSRVGGGGLRTATWFMDGTRGREGFLYIKGTGRQRVSQGDRNQDYYALTLQPLFTSISHVLLTGGKGK